MPRRLSFDRSIAKIELFWAEPSAWPAAVGSLVALALLTIVAALSSVVPAVVGLPIGLILLSALTTSLTLWLVEALIRPTAKNARRAASLGLWAPALVLTAQLCLPRPVALGLSVTRAADVGSLGAVLALACVIGLLKAGKHLLDWYLARTGRPSSGQWLDDWLQMVPNAIPLLVVGAIGSLWRSTSWLYLVSAGSARGQLGRIYLDLVKRVVPLADTLADGFILTGAVALIGALVTAGEPSSPSLAHIPTRPSACQRQR